MRGAATDQAPGLKKHTTPPLPCPTPGTLSNHAGHREDTEISGEVEEALIPTWGCLSRLGAWADAWGRMGDDSHLQKALGSLTIPPGPPGHPSLRRVLKGSTW